MGHVLRDLQSHKIRSRFITCQLIGDQPTSSFRIRRRRGWWTTVLQIMYCNNQTPVRKMGGLVYVYRFTPFTQFETYC